MVVKVSIRAVAENVSRQDAASLPFVVRSDDAHGRVCRTSDFSRRLISQRLWATLIAEAFLSFEESPFMTEMTKD